MCCNMLIYITRCCTTRTSLWANWTPACSYLPNKMNIMLCCDWAARLIRVELRGVEPVPCTGGEDRKACTGYM